mmetsp:Transcript_17269/g.50344  ORF Transcript_17269/g.50344 Transcript_17269/m.50344 type:complete len:299 (-) Transcript_17269:1265-2161(-)
MAEEGLLQTQKGGSRRGRRPLGGGLQWPRGPAPCGLERSRWSRHKQARRWVVVVVEALGAQQPPRRRAAEAVRVGLHHRQVLPKEGPSRHSRRPGAGKKRQQPSSTSCGPRSRGPAGRIALLRPEVSFVLQDAGRGLRGLQSSKSGARQEEPWQIRGSPPSPCGPERRRGRAPAGLVPRERAGSPRGGLDPNRNPRREGSLTAGSWPRVPPPTDRECQDLPVADTASSPRPTWTPLASAFAPWAGKTPHRGHHSGMPGVRRAPRRVARTRWSSRQTHRRRRLPCPSASAFVSSSSACA